MRKLSYVYLMGNARPILYIDVTDDLIQRVYEHKIELTEGYTKRYSLRDLLYYEVFDGIKVAINREKQLKHWKRE